MISEPFSVRSVRFPAAYGAPGGPDSHEAPGIVHPTERDWEETLAATPGVIIVDFWAPWCRPCQAIAPVLEDLVGTSGGTVTLAKVNVDEQPGLAVRFGIHSIPTLLFVTDGRIVDQVVGAVPKGRAKAQARHPRITGAGALPEQTRTDS